MNRLEIIKAMSNVKIATSENLSKAIENLEQVLLDSHCFNNDWYSTEWHVDDVLSRAEDNGNPITFEQAHEVMGYIIHNHDADLGINWDVIDATIDIVLNNNK